MKSFTTTLMTAAAALMVLAGTASAQMLNTTIPFAFNVGNSHMDAGSYRVAVRYATSGVRTIQFYSLDSKASIVSIPQPGGDVPNSWKNTGRAVLTFACLEGHCSLRSVWTDDSPYSLRIPAPKNAKYELAGVEIINIPVNKAD